MELAHASNLKSRVMAPWSAQALVSKPTKKEPQRPSQHPKVWRDRLYMDTKPLGLVSMDRLVVNFHARSKQ